MPAAWALLGSLNSISVSLTGLLVSLCTILFMPDTTFFGRFALSGGL
ncbi:MAG: hypothetical protein H0W55_05150 [Actinobacteria bacterium]|nr:hypothetical protein [Actinomycetota bacterium]MDQ3533076.1 hypothetical protein [Actinomycetota bacterium]